MFLLWTLIINYECWFIYTVKIYFENLNNVFWWVLVSAIILSICRRFIIDFIVSTFYKMRFGPLFSFAFKFKAVLYFEGQIIVSLWDVATLQQRKVSTFSTVNKIKLFDWYYSISSVSFEILFLLVFMSSFKFEAIKIVLTPIIAFNTASNCAIQAFCFVHHECFYVSSSFHSKTLLYYRIL